MADITENLTAQMQETLEKGISLAIFSKNPQVVPLHIFWALLADSNSILNQVFNKMNVSKDAVELEVKSKISSLPSSSNVTKDNVSVSRELMKMQDEGLIEVQKDRIIIKNSDELLDL